jgi:isopentenyl-diphosphate delta-isomerase
LLCRVSINPRFVATPLSNHASGGGAAGVCVAEFAADDYVGGGDSELEVCDRAAGSVGVVMPNCPVAAVWLVVCGVGLAGVFLFILAGVAVVFVVSFWKRVEGRMSGQPGTVTLVTIDNQIIGPGEVKAAHRRRAQFHRPASVWVWRRSEQGEAEVLLQQRSTQKILGALWWGNAVCGNVRWGESEKGCGLRRLKEEIGLSGLKLELLYLFCYRSGGNSEYHEAEWDYVYKAEWIEGKHAEPIPEESEVANVAWVEWRTLLSAVEVALKRRWLPEPEETVEMSDEKLDEHVGPVKVELRLDGEEPVLLTPWTTMMVRELGRREIFN